MAKVIELLENLENFRGNGEFIFDCKGCGISHSFTTKKSNSLNAIWSFNGDVNNPTFQPSLLVRWVDYKTDSKKNPIPKTRKEMICHSFVINGKIQYLNDCTHALAGQTIELDDIVEPLINSIKMATKKNTTKPATEPTKAVTKDEKKPATKAATKAKDVNDLEKILNDFESNLGKTVEHHFYNNYVLPLKQRYEAGEQTESLTNAILELKHP